MRISISIAVFEFLPQRFQHFNPYFDQKLKYEILDMINKYSDRTGLSDHFEPILIFQNLLRPSPLGFEVHTYVIFSQSGDHFPIIFCPLILPHSIRNNMSIMKIGL